MCTLDLQRRYLDAIPEEKIYFHDTTLFLLVFLSVEEKVIAIGDKRLRNYVFKEHAFIDAEIIIPQEKFTPKILNDIRLSELGVERNIMEEQKCDQIRKMLDYLPEGQREVVLMRFYEDLSFKEIARKTGVSINTSLGRMRYALINLRKMVREHDMALVG